MTHVFMTGCMTCTCLYVGDGLYVRYVTVCVRACVCECLCVAPKLYEKSEFANATDTNMTFTTKLVGRCKAMQDPLTNSDFLYTSIF